MADENFTPERRQAVESLYFRNFEYLKELTYSDPNMAFDDAERIIQIVAGHLSDYTGPLSDEDFRGWATKALLPVLGFYGIKRLCAEPVREAIRTIFIGYEWPGDTESARDDAEQNTWVWVVLHLKKLLDPRQRPVPWITTVARYKAKSIRTSMVRGNRRFVSGIDLERIGKNFTDSITIQPPNKPKNDQFDENNQKPYVRTENIKIT